MIPIIIYKVVFFYCITIINNTEVYNILQTYIFLKTENNQETFL